ncbi:MAG: thioredoxin domain-containing protein [Bacillota bacterium]
MKHTLFISILSVVLIPSFSFARLSDGKDHLKLSGSKITATLDKGFHFNKEAPAGLYLDGEMGAIEPLKKTEKVIVFDATKGKDKSFTVSFYVCDDAKTVCESHESHLEIKKGKLLKVEDKKEEMAPPGAAVNPSEKPAASKKEIVLLKDEYGFYENNFEQILAMAKTENKKILVDFMAPWCPACIRLETETFGEASFQEATEEFIKVSVNADKKENQIFLKQYGVPGMPTILILSPEGAELARFLDFKPARVFAKEINDYKKGQLLTFVQLKKKADAGDEEARILLARRAFNSMHFGEAIKWLAPTNKKSMLLTMSEAANAEIQYQKDKIKNRAPYQVALEKAISDYPQSIEAVVLRNELAELLKRDGPAALEKAQKVAKQNIAVIDDILQSGEKVKAIFAENLAGDFTNFEAAKLWSEKYKAAKILGDEGLKKEAQKQVSKLVNPELKTEFPGAMIAGLSLLRSVDLKEESLNGVEKLAKTYPQSEVYQQKAAFAFARDKKFEKALPYSEKITQMNSDSAFLNMKNLAEVYKGLNRKAEALQTAEKALKMPEAQMKQNKELVSSLEEMKKSLK